MSKSESNITLKVERGWLENIVDILEGKKDGIHKEALIRQLKEKIQKNKDKIKTKDENSQLTPM